MSDPNQVQNPSGHAPPPQPQQTVPPAGQPYAMQYASPSAALSPGYVEPDPSQRTLAMLAHLLMLAGLWLGPLILYLIKKDDPSANPYVKDQMKEVLNWAFTVLILMFVLGITIIGLILIPVVAVGHLVLLILNAVKANKGEVARYPWSIKFFK